MKKVLILLMASMLLVSAVLIGCGEPEPTTAPAPEPTTAPAPETKDPDSLALATMGTRSSSYITGVTMSEMWNRYLGLRSMSSGGGSAQALMNLYIKKEADLAFTTGENAWSSARNTKWFEGNESDPRIFLVGYSTAPLLWVRADSDIYSFEDLQGKICAFYTKVPGIATDVAHALLEFHGMTIDDVNHKTYTSSSEGNAWIKERVIDAWMMVAAPPKPWFRDLESTTDMRIIGATEEEWSYLKEQFGTMLVRQELPAGSYKGQDEDLLCFGGKQMVLLVQPELPEDMVYDLIKTLDENAGEFNKTHKDNIYWNLETNTTDYEKWMVPIHPGIAKYMKEKGLWTDKHEEAQQRLFEEIK